MKLFISIALCLCLVVSIAFSLQPMAALRVQKSPQPQPPPVAGGGCDTVNDSDLKAYWKLDEASGDRADSKGANTLTDNNTVTSQAGKISNAAEFTTGNTEYFTRADTADVSVSSTFTIGFWFKTKSDQAAGTGLVEKTGEYKIKKTASDNINFTVVDSGAGGGVDVSSSETINNDTWYFVVCWYDAGDKLGRISINDGTASVSGAPMSNGPLDGAAIFYLGIDTAVGYADVLIDEVFITKRLLTAGEKTALYNSGTACRPGGL